MSFIDAAYIAITIEACLLLCAAALLPFSPWRGWDREFALLFLSMFQMLFLWYAGKERDE